MDLEKAKAYLKKTNNGGESVHSHICKIVLKIIEENPKNPLEMFENFSLAVKSGINSQTLEFLPTIPLDEDEKRALTEWLDQLLKLCGYKAPVELTDEDIEPVEEPEIDVTRVADVYKSANLLRQVGVSLGEQETYTLQLACKQLSLQHEGFKEPRFFGKLYGTDADYWVVEAKEAEPSERPEDAEETAESPGEGLNQYIYFVCGDLVKAQWELLPNITPSQIKEAKPARRLMTGNLKSKVYGRMRFNWTEAELLRAQIARIACATMIAPNGLYQLVEDSEDPTAYEKAEEFTAPEEESMATAGAWVHTRGHLRMEARILKYEKPPPDDDEAEVPEPTEEELEEVIPLLREISTDTSPIIPANETDPNMWKFQSFNKDLPFQVVSVQNKLWPGAVTAYIAGSSEFVNIYIGNGLKYTGKIYAPPNPPPIMSQFNEWEENEVEDPENEGEMKIVKTTIFKEQEDVMPPPPEPEPVPEEAAAEDAGGDAEAAEDE